ncbi:hypothetical protein DNTS_030146, partial [Danionella cerebrum]
VSSGLEALEVSCHFKNDSSVPCYAALGHKLKLQIPLDKQYNITESITKTSQSFCKFHHSTLYKDQCNLYEDRDVFLTNGTLIINTVKKEDEGAFTVRLEDPEGKTIDKNFTVIVEAPIGSVNVTITYSSNGSKTATCFSERDSRLFSWTLNGNPLNDSLLRDGNQSVQLDEKTNGNITCRVKNNINSEEKTEFIKPCPAPIGSVEVSISCSSNKSKTATCFSAGDSRLFSWTLNGNPLNDSLLRDGNQSVQLDEKTNGNITCRVKNNINSEEKTEFIKPCPASPGDADLIYAKISHKNQKKKSRKMKTDPSADVEYAAVKPQKRKQNKEDEVQYGEVTFTPHTANMTIKHQQRNEECVYSQVQRS